MSEKSEKPEATVNAVVTKTRSPNVAGDIITMSRAEFDEAVGIWVEAHDGSTPTSPEENRQRQPARRTR